MSQEAAEGEPVRRHVADQARQCEKPVYGLFVARRLDPNTVETFRHGVWYLSPTERTRLNILPMSLEGFRQLFARIVTAAENPAEAVHQVLNRCTSESLRDDSDAPGWGREIRMSLDELFDQFSG